MNGAKINPELLERIFPFRLTTEQPPSPFVQLQHVFPGEEHPFHLLDVPSIKIAISEREDGWHYTYYAATGSHETFYSKIFTRALSNRITCSRSEFGQLAWMDFTFSDADDDEFIPRILQQIKQTADKMTRMYGVSAKSIEIGPYKGIHRVGLTQRITRNKAM